MKSKVFIETHGCQMNVADTERAQTRLLEAGYGLARDAAEADVVLLNTCSVRAKAERKVFNRINALRRERGDAPAVFGVMGCVAQLEGEALFARHKAIDLIIGTRATDRIPALLDSYVAEAQPQADLSERGADAGWQVEDALRHSRQIAFVPIIEGCNKFCTYCIVPYSRGRERSRPATEILGEVRRLRESGVKEVHLIGQNVNSYRPTVNNGLEEFNGATPFARLLRAVAATGIERVKFTTSFPRDFHPDIVLAIEDHANLCNWVHLPVQSGSNRILQAMRRGYTVERYREKVAAIKHSAPRRIALTTDLIVGFPGETEADFRATLALVEETGFDGIYIFNYSARGGTPAARLPDDVPDAVKRERFRRLQALHDAQRREILRAYIGQESDVLVTGISAKSRADLTGYTTCHKIVNFAGTAGQVGAIVKVGITAAKVNSLYGKQLISEI